MAILVKALQKTSLRRDGKSPPDVVDMACSRRDAAGAEQKAGMEMEGNYNGLSE